MKSLICAIASLTAPVSLYAQTPEPAEKPPLNKEVELNEQFTKFLTEIGVSPKDYVEAKIKNINNLTAFSKLPKEKRLEFSKQLAKSKKMAADKRIAESLYAALEAKTIFPENLQVLAALGSAYVELRDFTSAREIYVEASRLDPVNPGITFNQAEVEFVDKKYSKSLSLFKKTEKMTNGQPAFAGIDQLIIFKIELCNLALSKDQSLSEAVRKQHREYFDTAVDSRDFRDHRLITYYGLAVKAFDAGKEAEGRRVMAQANYVFNKKATHTAWLDTLIEFGCFVNSFVDKTKTAPATKDSATKPASSK